jgi:hypothetical protein
VRTRFCHRLALSVTGVACRLHLGEHSREDLSLLDGDSRASTGLASVNVRVGSGARSSTMITQGLAREGELQGTGKERSI